MAKSERSVAKGAKAARLQHEGTEVGAKILKEKRALSGPTRVPRVIVLFGLSACVNLDDVEEDILSLLSDGRNTSTFPAVASSEYKLRATVLKAPHGDLVTCMKMAGC